MGSQDEDYTRADVATEIEREIFDSGIQTVPNVSANKETRDQRMASVPDKTSTLGQTDLISRKRPVPPEPVPRTAKRNIAVTKTVTDELREETIETFLRALRPLSEQEGVSDLVERTAKRLERDLYGKISKERPVNPLGRSSTLVSASRKPNLMDKYNAEKEKLSRKVEAYVILASRDDIELEQVQQGEIWEVIKQVLDGDS